MSDSIELSDLTDEMLDNELLEIEWRITMVQYYGDYPSPDKFLVKGNLLAEKIRRREMMK